MAVSSSDLIPRVRTQLNENVFATQGSAADATSVIAVTDGTDFEEGAVIEMQDNGEQAKVISVSGNNLTCFRGWNGTTGTAHAASTTILRGFKYSYNQISAALSTAVKRLWPYAWKTEPDTITIVAGTRWYDLTATQVGMIEVSQIIGSGTSQDVRRYGVDGRSFDFRRDLSTTVAASTVGISFPDGLYHASNDISVLAAAKITGTSDIDDDVEMPVADAVVTGALAVMAKGAGIEELALTRSRSKVGSGLSVFAALESEFRMKLTMLKILHDERYPIIQDEGW